MSIRMAALSGRTQTTTFTFQDQEVAVTFRPNYMTPERQAVLTASDAEQKATESFVGLVVGMIESWDVLDENDQPLPVTAELAVTLPYSFLSACIVAAGEASRPGEAARP